MGSGLKLRRKRSSVSSSPVTSFQSLTGQSSVAGLFRQQLGQFSLIVSVISSAVKARGMAGVGVGGVLYCCLYQEDYPEKTGTAKIGLVSVPIIWGHRSLCESGEMYGASLPKNAMISPIFSPQPAQGSWLRN